MKRRVVAILLPVGALLTTMMLLLPMPGCPHGDRALSADPRLPERVRQISIGAQQRGEGPSAVLREIRAAYGQPTLQAGTTEQWRIDSGTLAFNPAAGVFFVSGRSEMIRVVRHQNPLEPALFGRYEMTTPPDPRHRQARYYLGDLELRVDGTYLYQHALLREPRPDQANNFFILHPSGACQITYLNGCTPQTLLESISGRSRIVKLIFRASDGAERTFFVTPGSHTGRLVFECDEGMEFEMEMPWDRRWG